ITSGVVQGSVLGPLLFIIYINSICRCFITGNPYLYADDLKVVYKTDKNDVAHCIENMQDELNKLGKWCSKWCLEFNTEKCGWMCVGDPKLEVQLVLSNHKLPKLNTVTDLGIQYSHNINFSEHISAKLSKSRRLLGFILRNFHQNESRLSLYKICVRPTLEYCSFLFSDLRTSDKIRVESVQRYLTRQMIKGNSKIDYKTRCHMLGLEPLWKRRLRTNLILFYKLLHDMTYTSINIAYRTYTRDYYLRNKISQVKIENYKTKARANFYLIRYGQIWNKLPAAVRMADNLPVFCKLLNTALRDISFLVDEATYSDTLEVIGPLNI
ncbi:hypothetical protein MN116_000359, partial [Schistosoma mekongi]